VTGDSQARICERLGVKFPGPTRPGVGLSLLGRIPADGGFPDSYPTASMSDSSCLGRLQLSSVLDFVQQMLKGNEAGIDNELSCTCTQLDGATIPLV
jgi:hypothetical protein